MGLPVQDPAMRDLLQSKAPGKDEPIEQQLAEVLKMPNKYDADMSDFVRTLDRPRSLKYNVCHPRQEKNHKRYFHENLAHHPTFNRGREFDRPDGIRRNNSTVPNQRQGRGQISAE